MPPAQTPSPASNFLPTFRFRRPPWESSDAPHATPVTAVLAPDGLSSSSSEQEQTDAEEEGGGRVPRTDTRARGGGGDDWEEGEGDEDDEDDEEDEDEDEDEEEGAYDEVPMEIDNPFDPTALGLKEIGNLASWTVSSCKPGCGVDALRDDDTGLFWQSDGPQPHHLNIHFSRLVSILSIRIFLDFEADESYTPTRITLLAGTAYHDLTPFAALSFEQPKGWIDVPLDHVGGAPDGRTLRVFLVQVRIVENHQNGKDTHLRGLKIYARDDRASRGLNGLIGEKQSQQTTPVMARQAPAMERSWLIKPDWMGEPELR
ncbi:hypothetical protein LZ554_004430 [Drepanopeziza brunnea f. sp. 'monogermtubi']|nr:hypothetical protein LZ554_004430 [Drepanopeziza brunnea f. sp. 'monogermtubi']